MVTAHKQQLSQVPSVNFLDPRLPLIFWDKCMPEPNSGCWLWCGATGSCGYGNITVAQCSYNAHRFAYIALIGSVPDGLVLDHRVCHQPACCNPAHLEPVTQQTNIRRGLARFNGAHHRAKTHCPKGHPYFGENLYVHNGKRHCRACRKEQW